MPPTSPRRSSDERRRPPSSWSAPGMGSGSRPLAARLRIRAWNGTRFRGRPGPRPSAPPGSQLASFPARRRPLRGPIDPVSDSPRVRHRRARMVRGLRPEPDANQKLRGGGQGRNRTIDTRIFSPLLYQLSYLATGGWARTDRPCEGRELHPTGGCRVKPAAGRHACLHGVHRAPSLLLKATSGIRPGRSSVRRRVRG